MFRMEGFISLDSGRLLHMYDPNENPGLLQDVLNACSDLLFLVRFPSGEIIQVNEEAGRSLGICPGEIPLFSWEEITDFPLETLAGGDTFRIRLRGGSGQKVEAKAFARKSRTDESLLLVKAQDLPDPAIGSTDTEKALKTHQILLHSLLNSIDNAVLALDRDFRVIYFNKEYLRLYPFGRKFMNRRPHMKEIISRACEIGIYPEEQREELTARRFDHLRDAGEHGLFKIPRQDGIVVEGFATKLPMEGYLITYRDITEQKRSEKRSREAYSALEMANDRLNGIIEGTHDPIAAMDMSYRFLAFNSAYRVHLNRHFQIRPRLGETLSQVFSSRPEDLQAAMDTWSQALNGETFTRIWHRADEEGRTFHYEVSFNPIWDEKGEQIGASHILRDISERQRNEDALRQALQETAAAKDRIDAILKSVVDGLMVMDNESRIILMNRASEELLGFRFVEAVGRFLEDCLQDTDLKEKLSTTLLQSNPSQQVDFLLPTADPENPRTIQARTSVMLSREEKKTGTIIILQDVTRAREIERMKTEFVSMAAHELRTPLTSIRGYSELLLNRDFFGDFPPEQQQEFLREIQDKTEVLTRIIEDMLNISRIESGQCIPLEMREFRMDELIRKIVGHYRMQHPAYRFDLELAARGDGPVCADRHKVLQVLENLLSNAVKYSPAGGQVRISGHATPTCYEVAVEDEGIGMTPEQVERIYDKFYRADFSTTAYGGLGLGMSIVKNIIQSHGGQIEVWSRPHQGTKVFFSIPLGRDGFC